MLLVLGLVSQTGYGDRAGGVVEWVTCGGRGLFQQLVSGMGVVCIDGGILLTRDEDCMSTASGFARPCLCASCC